MIPRVLLVGGLILLMIDVARMQASGVALLGALLIVIAFALKGLFTVEFWLVDAETSERLDLVDQDIDRQARR